MSVVKQTLDHAGVAPNPARDPRVKLPSVKRVIDDPPSAREVALILENVSQRMRLVVLRAKRTPQVPVKLIGIGRLRQTRPAVADSIVEAAHRQGNEHAHGAIRDVGWIERHGPVNRAESDGGGIEDDSGAAYVLHAYKLRR